MGTSTSGVVWGQFIMRYVKSPQVYECPSFGNIFVRQNSYMSRGCSDATFGHYGWFSVAGSGPDYNTVQGYKTDPSGAVPVVPLVRHLETPNVLFADGHVKARKFYAFHRRPASVTAMANWKLWFPEES